MKNNKKSCATINSNMFIKLYEMSNINGTFKLGDIIYSLKKI